MFNTINHSPTTTFTFDNITRCIKCNLLCSLDIRYKDGNPIIIFSEKGHSGNILLYDYLSKYNEFSLLKEKCKDCGKNSHEIKGISVLCKM